MDAPIRIGDTQLTPTRAVRNQSARSLVQALVNANFLLAGNGGLT